MTARLEPLSGEACLRISSLREKIGNGIPLQKLLAEMDAYNWDSVEDMPINEGERRKRLSYLHEVIRASGIQLNGSILDVASGISSLAYLYPDVVVLDNDPRKIKMLRKDGIKGVVANIESLPFEDKSFDYVVSISPPQKLIILHRDGFVRFDVNHEYNRKIVDAALRIAREKVLISCYDITMQSPYNDLVEKKGIVHGFYKIHYVVYKASNNHN